MNIVLVTPSDHSQGCEYVYAGRENLGVEYLLAALRNYGFHAISCNENLIQDDIEKVVSPADLVGFSLPFWEYREQYVDLIQKVSSLSKGKVIAGGHAATIGAEYFLRKCQSLSGIVMGEGEETIIHLVKELNANGDLKNLPGFYTRNGFEKRRLGFIDALPFPERDELKILLRQERSIKEAYVSTTRGCHNACSFCSIPPYYKLAHGPRWRERSAESVCGELEDLLSKYPELDSISFVDDNFLGFNPSHRERGLIIAKKLHELKSDIAFEITCRVDSVEYELFGRLAECGLSGAYLGIESGVQRILDLFRKNTTVKKNLQAIETIAQLGLCCDIGFIMFCPSITLDEVEENFYFLKTIIERFGVYVHPAVVFRSLKTYPTDFGIAALKSSADTTECIQDKTKLLYLTLNSIWQTNYEATFLKLEHDLLFPSESGESDIPQTFEFTLNMIDIGLRLIKELRKHDKLTEKDLAMARTMD
jgi:radical SAM superfamily enzyme YgiQ (UPF0313 family)